MSFERWFETAGVMPVCIGTGFVVLDFVVNGAPDLPSLLWTGGSCGNVLMILSYLNWKSFPFARLGNDGAGQYLLNDMKRWGVETDLISVDHRDKSPIVVHKILYSQDGASRHHYEFRCPNCGSPLPRYRPVQLGTVRHLANNLPQAQVLYFDRVTRSSIELASIYRNQGSLIVFEPSGAKSEALFLEALQLADIVKYSHERLRNAKELLSKVNVPLEIRTFGAQGLQYRLRKNGHRHNTWKTMDAYPVRWLRDAAGSGDWCSAGIIHALGNFGRRGFEDAQIKEVESALQFGQALATLNCYYEGARGTMYHVPKEKLPELLGQVLIGDNNPSALISNRNIDRGIASIKSICPNCAGNHQVAEQPAQSVEVVL